MGARSTPADPLFWGGLAFAGMGIAAVALLALAAAPAHVGERAAPAPDVAAVAPPAPAATESARVLAAWRTALDGLCHDARLRALGLDVDCASGAVVLPSRVVFAPNSSEISATGRRALRAAAPIVLAHLSRNPRVWEHLEAIEVRGHADPFAEHDPYSTNLGLSIRRALAVLLFLTSDDGIAERHRVDLRQIAIASGAAHSRPPLDCPQPTRECSESWRRVELRPVIDGGSLAAEPAPAAPAPNRS